MMTATIRRGGFTKVEPFMDDFNDDASTGWTLSSGFAAANTMLQDTDSGSATDAAWKNDFTDDDHEIRFSYRRTSSNSGDRVSVYARFVDWDNYVRVEFFANNTCRVLEKANGNATIIATGTAASTTNVWYDVRIVCDDTSVKAYHKTGTNLESQVLSATVAVTSSNKIGIVTWSNTTADLDTIWLIGDSLSNTTAFAVNNANELTTMTDPNGTTTFGFDAWGRMTSKARGSHGAEYTYSYDLFLTGVETNFPGESDVEYRYGGDGRRRLRASGLATAAYKLDGDWNTINVEDGAGDLVLCRIDSFGEVIGEDPLTGTFQFYSRDMLESGRVLRYSNSLVAARWEHSPYGEEFAFTGTRTSPDFAGLERDDSARLQYAAFRYYNPDTDRWLTRDPLGPLDGLNLYQYVGSNPVGAIDPLGLAAWTPAQCERLRKKIAEMSVDLAKEILKYDPVADFRGGFFCKYRPTGTIPGGHFEEIRNLQKGIAKRVAKYAKYCLGPKGPPGMPPIPQPIHELAIQKIPMPHAGGLPNPLPYMPGSDQTIYNIATVCGLVGIGAAACATGGTGGGCARTLLMLAPAAP